METPLHPGLRQNRLLALLDEATLRALASLLEPVALAHRENLYIEGKPMTHTWFPIDGVLSMMGADSATGTPIEVATIGSEGMLGVPLFLGAQTSPGTVFVQVTGSGWRLPAPAFHRALESHAEFALVLRRYTYALLVQVAQGTACNRAHAAEQRCARWLLQTHDRVSGDTFDLTQEFLAQMLGERRATVNQVASALQNRGLIRYTRGRIEVIDRPGLEQAACGCYSFVREEYARNVAPWP
jgi:CRP-like cAMP-binding protein